MFYRAGFHSGAGFFISVIFGDSIFLYIQNALCEVQKTVLQEF